MTIYPRASSAEDVELSAKNQTPLYEDIEAVRDTHSTPAPTDPLQQPSGNYQFTTCPAYAPNTITAQSSRGGEGDGEYAIPRDEVSGVARRNA